MLITGFDIDGPLLIEPKRHGDARGFFAETWRQDLFQQAAGPVAFVQDNHSRSAKRGTVRGLHYQKPPAAQGKLVSVIRGAVLDVVVDARRASPTFGRHIAVELSGDDGRQLWVPPGFLHGFCTLTDDCDVLYKVTAYYAAAHDAGVRWDDPALGIRWPVTAGEATVSPKDAAAPAFADMPPVFG